MTVDRGFIERTCRDRRAAVASMGGPLFAARSRDLFPPWLNGGGTSNGVPTSLKVEAPGAERWMGVTVTTMTERITVEEEMIVARLLGEDLFEPLVFPITSTIHRGKIPMRVLGRRRPVTIYACGASWLARTKAGGRWLWIKGFGTDPRAVEVVKLAEAEVGAALDLSDAVTRWIYDRHGPDPLRPVT
jgi:hypothetical protein